VGQEEGTARGVFCVPEEQILGLTDHSVVSFGCFFSLKQEVFHLLFIRK